MSYSRRYFLMTVPSSLAAVALPAAAQAQFPARPVQLVVPYPAGGTTDVLTRAIAQQLAETWGKPVIVENKGGASTRLGAEAVAKAAPDGYTLLATAEATLVVNPYIYGKLGYEPSDFTPVAGMGLSTHILVAHPSFSARSVAELVALARANPGGVNYGTFGAGSSSHLNMELFQASAGIRMQAIHYRGAAPMMTDLLGGHVQVAFTGATLAAPGLKTGQLRALGVGSVSRLADFPDVATIAESFAGFQANSWFGLFAPAATPASVIAAINADVQRVLADPVFQDKFLRPNYLLPIPGSPEQFAHYVRDESEKWRRVIHEASIKVE